MPGQTSSVHIRGTDPNSVNYGTTLDNTLEERGTIVIQNGAKHRKRRHGPRTR
jgi:hypothetical protein